MTTIASFLSVSEGGERTLSMLSDSRITFSDGKTFDFSQKIFRLKQSLDVFGYSGSSLFSLSYLSQLISNLDYSLKFRNSKDILEKQGIVTEMLNEAFKNFPKAEVKRESCIYWNTYI